MLLDLASTLPPRLPVCLASSEQIANDDLPRSDAHPDAQGFARGGGGGLYTPNDLESGTAGSFRVVLIGDRVDRNRLGCRHQRSVLCAHHSVGSHDRRGPDRHEAPQAGLRHPKRSATAEEPTRSTNITVDGRRWGMWPQAQARMVPWGTSGYQRAAVSARRKRIRSPMVGPSSRRSSSVRSQIAARVNPWLRKLSDAVSQPNPPQPVLHLSLPARASLACS